MIKRIFITPTNLKELVARLKAIWPKDNEFLLETTVDVNVDYNLIIVPSSELQDFLTSDYITTPYIIIQEKDQDVSINFDELKHTNLKKIVQQTVKPRKLLHLITEIVQEQEKSINNNGKLIKIVSLNGGVGKSLIALNLSYQIGLENQKTVFFDNSFPFGALNSFIKLEPDYNIESIEEILKEEPPTLNQINNILTDTNYNFKAIANNHNSMNNHPLKHEQYSNLVKVLKKQYHYIIEDSNTIHTTEDLDLLKDADVIIFVLNPNVMNAFNFKTFLQILRGNNFLFSKSMLVMNKFNSYGKTKTDLHDFSSYFGIKIDHKIEEDSIAVYKFDDKDLIFTKKNFRKLVIYNDIAKIKDSIVNR